jgi:hypothetical protein
MTASRKTFEVDAELEALIQVHIHADERIRRVTHPSHLQDQASVHLIKQTLYEQLQKAKVPRVRNSGCGRVLNFERQQGNEMIKRIILPAVALVCIGVATRVPSAPKLHAAEAKTAQTELAARSKALNSQHTKWIAQSLREMQTIKAGMTRAQLTRVFTDRGRPIHTDVAQIRLPRVSLHKG